MGVSIEKVILKKLCGKKAETGDYAFLRYEGWLRDGGSATVMAFRSGGAKPSFLFKIAFHPSRFASLESELGNLRLLRRSPGLIKRKIPVPYGIYREGGALILAEGIIEGTPLKILPPAEVFSGKRRDGIRDSIAFLLSELARASKGASLELGEEVLEKAFRTPAYLYMKRFALDDREKRLLELYLERLGALRGLTIPLVFSHGDFCPSNLILADDGLYLIDWESPLEAVLPLADLFHFFSSCVQNFYPRRGATYAGRMKDFFSSKGRFSGDLVSLAGRVSGSMGLERKTVPFLFVVYWLNDALSQYGRYSDILSAEQGGSAAERDIFARWASDRRERSRREGSNGEGVYEDFRIVAECGDQLVFPIKSG